MRRTLNAETQALIDTFRRSRALLRFGLGALYAV